VKNSGLRSIAVVAEALRASSVWPAPTEGRASSFDRPLIAYHLCRSVALLAAEVRRRCRAGKDRGDQKRQALGL